jgi:ribosomal protein L19
MSNLIIEKLLAKTKRTDIPQFAPGDTVRVQVKIKEGDKERVQAFEGVVIARGFQVSAAWLDGRVYIQKTRTRLCRT